MMHRNRRTPRHTIPVRSNPTLFGTGYVKEREEGDQDERRLRGRPREAAKSVAPASGQPALRKAMRDARLAASRIERFLPTSRKKV
jgi:hypothetical protein